MALNKIKEWQLDLSGINAKIEAIGKPVNFKGRVDSVDQLPEVGADGDLYYVGPIGSENKKEYIWYDGAFELVGSTSREDYDSLHNDLDELGDKVAEIESKIPEGTSDTNHLINKQQLSDAIQGGGGGGGSVPDNVYTSDNLLPGKNIEFTRQVTGGGIDQYTLACWHFDGSNADEVNGLELSAIGRSATVYKFGNASVYDYESALSGNDISSLNIQDHSWTLDFWFYQSNYQSSGYGRYGLGAGNYNTDFLGLNIYRYEIQLRGALWGEAEGTTVATSTGTTWTHGAIQYDHLNKKGYLFIHGQKVYEGAVTADGKLFNKLYLCHTAGPQLALDEARISNVLRYSENFEPPTEPYGRAEALSVWKVDNTLTKTSELENDSGFLTGLPEGIYTQTNLLGGKDIEIVPEPVEGGIDSHTKALWHFDEDKIDVIGGISCPNNIYASQYKFGSGCIRPNKTATTKTDISSLGLDATKEVTVDFWFKPYSTSNTEVVGLCATPTDGLLLKIGATVSLSGAYWTDGDGTVVVSGLDVANWYHCGFCYGPSSKSVSIFINGEKKGTYGVTGTPSFTAFALYGSASYPYVDELRISDVIRYTSNFTPETEAYSGDTTPTGRYQINFTGEAGGAGASFPLFYHTFADHILNDASWLRSDTFSWQSGDVYKSAYDHLVSDYQKAERRTVTAYHWEPSAGAGVYTITETPKAGDPVYASAGSIYGKVVSYDSSANQITIIVSGYEYIMYRDSAEDNSNYRIEEHSETIGSTEILFYKTADGHKIVLEDQESKVSAIYRATGVAWYYILDTENKRFKLPRTKHAFTGLRNSVGGYVEAGLPNITGEQTALAWGSSSGVGKAGTGAFSKTTSTGGAGANTGDAYNSAKVVFDASLSDDTYGNSDTVQPPSTEQYLYFYVGNTVRNQTEVDVGAVTEQLNGKQDVLPNNVDYVIEAYNDGTNWYRVYKSGWIEQGGLDSTSGANGVTKTFLKPFSDTNYTLTATARGTFDKSFLIFSKTATTYTVTYSSSYSGSYDWYACGQGAI